MQYYLLHTAHPNCVALIFLLYDMNTHCSTSKFVAVKTDATTIHYNVLMSSSKS